MFCPECGAQDRVRGPFCSNCGSRMSTAQPSSVVSSPVSADTTVGHPPESSGPLVSPIVGLQPAVKAPSGRGGLILLGAVAIIVAGLGFGYLAVLIIIGA